MTDLYRFEVIERAKAWVPSFYAEHEGITSADALYAAMRDNNMYVPRWAVREAWGITVKAMDDADLMNRLDPSFVPPQSRHDEKPTWKTHEEWVYHVKLTGIDIYTGKSKEQYVTIETPERVSIGEIKASALGIMGPYNFDPFAGDITADITDYIHAGGLEE